MKTVIVGLPARRWTRHAGQYQLTRTKEYRRAMKIIGEAVRKGASVDMATRAIEPTPPIGKHRVWHQRLQCWQIAEAIHEALDITIDWSPS